MSRFLSRCARGIAVCVGVFGFFRAGMAEDLEPLALDVIAYEDFVGEDPVALQRLEVALHEKGIVGIRGVPGYREKMEAFIEAARAFCSLPEEVKEGYAPNHSLGETFLGYEKGKERFRRPDGSWVVDDLKVSYYGLVPDDVSNKWPQEVDLKTSYQGLGELMSDVGVQVMERIGLLGEKTGISLGDTPRTGRLLYYCKSTDSMANNPFWCGAHFDHSMFTALLPAFYFVDGKPIAEPKEAGLFVKATVDDVFRKVVADDPNVLLFQVGEFGQLATDDAICATEHRVHKAQGNVERYTFALFFNASQETVVHSQSVLTSDARYGAAPGEPCTFSRWQKETFNRFLVKEEK